MFLSCFLNINVSLCCFKSLTICPLVGYGEQQVPLRFDSTSVSLQKLAHLQIGESGRRGKAGVEKLVGEYLYACHGMFKRFLGIDLSLLGKPSSWHECMRYPYSKNVVFVQILLHPTLHYRNLASLNF